MPQTMLRWFCLSMSMGLLGLGAAVAHAATEPVGEVATPMGVMSLLERVRKMFPEYKIPDGAKTMVYNATGDLLGRLLDMGTVQNMNDRNGAATRSARRI